jgi:murein L,D-transpeptidase YcbB/YkuD
MMPVRVRSAAARRAACATAAVVATLTLAACGDGNAPQVVEGIRQQVTGSAPAAAQGDVWDDVRRFYEQRTFAPRWVNGGRVDEATAALRVLQRAPEHGLTAADYDEPDLSRVLSDTKAVEETLRKDPTKAAQLDVRVTTALLALGRDVALGRAGPAAIDSRWKLRREPPDFVATLSATVESSEDAAAIGTWLDRVRPRHPEYAALQKTLADLHTQAGSEAVTDDTRRLALNLERWRWLPDDLGARHVLVNVPAFYMAVREQGRPVLEMKVVVGTPERKTPLFSATMETVVFSPYWNVPDSIAEGETAPAAARDPRFLARNQIDILRRGSDSMTVVDPASVDWDDPEAVKSLAFRQRPGAHNALGHVKFLFPNRYDVYLHDTPADALFARQGRAFSHGCVRVEKPEALASYLLRDHAEWDTPRIEKAMHRDEEQHVALKEKLPVYIVYFTAWPDGQGGVQIWPDVYGYDAKQAGTGRRQKPAAPSAD